jgi:hypothetical protein
MPHPRSLLAALGLAAALACGGGSVARADMVAPPPDEARLAAGQAVSYPQVLYRQGRRYIGGVSYAVIEASADELTALLGDMAAYKAVLPHAEGARLVGEDGGDKLVEITQGVSFVRAAYTLRMRMDPDRRRVRFWLDGRRPHAIDDAWGYFRVEPIADAADGSPRVLLSYGVLVDLGPGLMRDLFESRILASMLSIPDRLRHYASARFRGGPRTG